jgi:hypothetical protein
VRCEKLKPTVFDFAVFVSAVRGNPNDPSGKDGGTFEIKLAAGEWDRGFLRQVWILRS